MRIAIIGTGGVALGYAAKLAKDGHEPVLYSHSGIGIEGLVGADIECTGKLTHTFRADATADLKVALAGADAVIIAIPAPRHQEVMDAMAPYLSAGQKVLISAELSFGGVYLAHRLKDRGESIAVTSLATTILMGRRTGPASVAVGAIRSRCETATLPGASADEALAFWQNLFGPALVQGQGPLSIALANLNPPIHMANALCNFTRIEKAEYWCNYDGITPGVANLIRALDAERLAVAAAYGVRVRTVEEHYQLSFGFPAGMTLAQMAAAVHTERQGPPGPVSTDTRFVTEDIPFGIVCVEWLGQKRGIPTPLHTAGIDIFSAIYGRLFRLDNKLLSLSENAYV